MPVCLLDDDPSVLRATGRLVRSAGWEATTFEDPQAFLSHAEAHHPRVAVLDIWMPGMDGLETQTRLRKISPSTRVIFLTSRDDPSIRAKAMSAGAFAFLIKPASSEELLTAIESAAASVSG